MTATKELPAIIVRIYKKRVTVLCPMGHLISGYMLDNSFGGSSLEANLGSYQNGHETHWHRQAECCKGKGH